jgi:hypothetical protein
MKGDNYMYYVLITGRIVTERDMRTAYEICNGSRPGIHPGHYEKWMHSIYGVVRSIPKDEITIEQLVRGNCKIDAIKKYKVMHGCSLSEARDAIDKM